METIFLLTAAMMLLANRAFAEKTGNRGGNFLLFVQLSVKAALFSHDNLWVIFSQNICCFSSSYIFQFHKIGFIGQKVS